MTPPVLKVVELCTEYRSSSGTIKAVDGVSFTVHAGETLCIVGESGSGKTVTALSLLGLIAAPGRITHGEILFEGKDLTKLSHRELARIRGTDMAMIFQDPMTSLNPAFPIGEHVVETLLVHQGIARSKARARGTELLAQVGIPDPALRYDAYPHELSGGMRQRVLIAGAIANDPKLLIADEPTTALDVTIQSHILRLLKSVTQQRGTALILVTHDLGVVAEMADNVAIMYAGRIVEYGDVHSVFAAPAHPYTQGLLRSLVRMDEDDATPLRPIPGSPPDLGCLPAGCRFAPRCPQVLQMCQSRYPQQVVIGTQRWAACHLLAGAAQDSGP